MLTVVCFILCIAVLSGMFYVLFKYDKAEKEFREELIKSMKEREK